jgi:Holliday junction resolvasome RuvABC DNA-binding subunit
MLGFSKNSIEKVIEKELLEDNQSSVEELVKRVLKKM